MTAALLNASASAKTLLDEPAKWMEDAELLSRSQVIERGQALYKAKIKPVVEPENIGKFLSINVLSGAYQIHETLQEVTAYEASLPHEAGAVPPRFLMRIGYTAAFKRGGKWRRICD